MTKTAFRLPIRLPAAPLALTVALAAALSSGCASMNRDAAAQADTTGSAATAAADASGAALDAAIAGGWRDPKNSARDAFRNPRETLAFFGVRPEHTVVEITPGAGGWYAEILAPYLRERGTYVAAMVDPMAAAEGRSRDYQQSSLDGLKTRLAAHPAQFDRAQVALFDPKSPRFAAPGSVDVVLTFRNVHNWNGGGLAPGYFKASFDALKPGGTLGVVDHRAKPGTDAETMRKSGYITEEVVIALATDAGFVLDARSEVNANPEDDTDHPNGVWTLPPTNRHDAEDAAQFRSIGESDRMTLRFRKPAV